MNMLATEEYAKRQQIRILEQQFFNSGIPHKEMYVNHYFHLNENTVDLLHSMIPEFGYNGFGELVFYRTYSRIKDDGSNENWSDVVIRVINGIFSIRKNHYIKNMIDWNENWWQGFARQVAISLFKMHWLPPGRGLWAMGTNFVYERGAMSLYNCFDENTKFLADGQIVTLKQMEGKQFKVIGKDYKEHEATVKCFGKQKLNHILFKPKYGKRLGKYNLHHKATANHRWILKSGIETTNLKSGDVVTIKPGKIQSQTQEYWDGLAHGMIFADGTKTHNHIDGLNVYRLELFGEKEEWRDELKSNKYYSHTQDSNNGLIFETYEELKDLPKNKSLEYKQGFFDGWSMFDGHDFDGDYVLDTINNEAATWLKDHSGILNYVLIHHRVETKDSNFGVRQPLNRLRLTKKEVDFVVSAILPIHNEQDVYCVVEPETKSFQLAHGIITGNCAALNLHGFRFGEDIEWLMDSLMVGVGVGFKALRDQINVKVPQGSYIYRIPDSREGWALSVRLLIEAFCQNKRLPIMEYSDIRPRGMPIQGFGGIASGPEPLQRLHGMIVETMYKYINKKIDIVRLKTDIANMVGVCVVAGNVRRSAEIAMGSIQDDSFMDLKDYEKYPDRQAYGWMSNNTAELLEDDDFELIREVANRVVVRGEPGIANLRNFKFGRIGKRNKNIREDKAKLLNPCGEITLEDREVCNLSETLPTRCETPAEWLDACRYASFYSSTVSLLPTHQPSTNAVIGRNRRIGVGIIDFTGWKQEFGLATVTKYLRKGYKIVRDTNTHFNSEAGVPSAIKVTTMKPGGTTPKIAGRTPGLGHPTFIYTLRSIRVADNAPVVPVLKRANIPYVIDEYDRHTLIFQFPIKQGPSKPSTEVSLWEQALNLVTLQREWSDNAVSNTLYFKPKWKLVSIYTPGLDEFLAQSSKFRELHCRFEGKLAAELEIGNYKIVKKSDGTYHFFEYNPQHEEGEIEHVLAHIAPLIKSCSLLPHSDTGAYKNMPEAGISEYEYNDRLSKIKKLDWSTFTGSDGLDERYCQGETCEVAK